jgi:hypothetical protein
MAAVLVIGGDTKGPLLRKRYGIIFPPTGSVAVLLPGVSPCRLCAGLTIPLGPYPEERWCYRKTV